MDPGFRRDDIFGFGKKSRCDFSHRLFRTRINPGLLLFARRLRLTALPGLSRAMRRARLRAGAYAPSDDQAAL
jgi:hypothetical protein